MTIERSPLQFALDRVSPAPNFANFFEILEDGLTQEATVILQPGNGYNVVDPATAAIKLKDSR
jgi:hypothetical protein